MRTILLSILLVVCFSTFAFAFDTGYHFDLTRSVLSEQGFSDQAIKIVQVENWLTDYYSSSPTAPEASRDDLEKLHFDNLFSTAEATNYWGRFLDNLREATRRSATDDDALAMLTTIGIALHATQDFYTHSNWVETHPRVANAPYRTETFIASRPVGGVALVTGKYPQDRKGAPASAVIHGGYATGLNHDSQIRPRWDEAYVFAYCGSHEVLGLLEQWATDARPGFWKRVQQYSVAANTLKDLEYDLRAVRNISMWINAREENGHWKGNRSGSTPFFSLFSSQWVGESDSIFVKQVADRKLHKRLTANLYAEKPATPLPIVGRFSLRRKAILIRTTLIKEQDVGRFEVGIDAGGKADFYALFSIGAQTFIERVIQDQKSFADPWFVVYFVDESVATLPVNIAVWDEDDTDSGGQYKDDHIDINPVAKKRDVEFVLRLVDGQLTGDVVGRYDSPASVFTFAGAKPDDNRGALSGFVTSVRLH